MKSTFHAVAIFLLGAMVFVLVTVWSNQLIQALGLVQATAILVGAIVLLAVLGVLSVKKIFKR